MVARPAAGGGRWVEVDPIRLVKWLEGFAERHGGYAESLVTADGDSGQSPPDAIRLVGVDGATADVYPPPGVGRVTDLNDLVTGAMRSRRIGLLLARQAAVAVGIAENGRLVVSKVDTSYVQGRTAAGGWSQHRFARRRENQAKAAAGTAADLVARLLVAERSRLDAFVTGGDRHTVDIILADARLVALATARSDRFLDVPQPRLAVLEQAITQAQAVRIRVRDPHEHQ